jgi:hypothetical protein
MMASLPPAPEPLRTILAAILHSNIYSGWRSELGSFTVSRPGYGKLIRRQWASAALGKSITFEEFRDLTHQEPTDDASMRAWLRDHYRMFYGRDPEERDLLE